MTKTALTILAPGFEETEAVTVIDIMRRASIEVTTAALDEINVPGSHRIPIQAEILMSDVLHGRFDALVLPGGMRGVQNMLQSQALLDLVRRMASEGSVIAAVCAAPLVLDTLGLLVPNQFTCHPCVYDQLKTPIALTDGISAPYVIHGNVVTGRSAGCAMIWALALVQRLTGQVDNLFNGLRLEQNPVF